MHNAKAFSAASATSPLAPTSIARRDLKEQDARIEIHFCGICHSDLGAACNELGGTDFSIVFDQEIVCRVTAVGSTVTMEKHGDIASVGSLVVLDCNCPRCQAGLEKVCSNLTLTFASPDKLL